jgi:hypothetical protein
MSITATVEHDTIKLPEGVHLPDGTKVQILPVRGPAPQTFAERYKEFNGCIKDAPPDLADNHDHYLYGTQKHN